MNYKVLTLLACGLFSYSVMGQNEPSTLTEVSKKEMSPEVYLDSIKKTFVNHASSASIEKRWLNELLNQDLFNELENELADANFDEGDVRFDELPTELLKERLKRLNEKTPFNVEYNETLERVIKSFLKNRKRSFERLLGLSEYYFPMFEEQLAKQNVPLEVKYLSIVESALNPVARSRVGATGLWQFMYPTGKQYNLEVTSYIDDRIDPLKSSEAAAKFLSDLYGMFGDWDLVLASYNAGPGNVSKAIRRSNGYTNYWNIRPNLPRETQNYLPAFYATMYIFEYAKEHGITSKNAPIKVVETDTIAIKKTMSFDQIANLLDVSKEEIEFLNPTYKLQVIPYDSGKLNFLRLPIKKIGLMASNEEKMYAYVDFLDSKKEQPNYAIVAESIVESSSVNPRYHTIRKGESVGTIANKYGISVAQLKKLNNLKGNLIYPGKKLVVGKKAVAQASGGTKNNFYTVQRGDSLSSISKKFAGVTVSKLKSLNNMKDSDDIRPGMKLRLN
ncbi:LysM peptidoglycan-binding domain-containing protein [Myroides odoratimimus]|uniref:lytic transglycosylase domain-containing protein n=1 Tax=Myroides odoratimimus TaxID=76832 RepID=UPI0025790D3C|nr:lytic transglycosylase domain-containing protein [Myroides odoratimimus]MDM1517904.1 LysM peptidoglycan-binding domain-containing protein [Myroides odoratimimus]MDM1536363.1 LysM peptidoglycan-binding domain-containing protein [Myroides odoratimimus]MDM1675935.1 LysM peptidoglycan-binding domain-containing protein [Myroides odoratimimus]